MLCFIAPQTTVLNWVLLARIYVKIALILHLNDFSLGTVHKHLHGGPDAKRGALKIFEVWKGGPEKNTLILPLKNESIWFSVGLTPIFLAKKGGPKKFGGPKGGPWKFFALNFFFVSGPPWQVFVNGPLICF